MTVVAVSKIVVDGNIRTVEGIDDLSSVEVKDLPSSDKDGIIELANNIKSVGLLQPLGVKALKNDRYRLIYGWRRLMAHKYLGKTTVDVKILKGKKEDESIQQLVENVHRKDLNPMDIARSLDVLRVERNLKDQNSLAKFVDKSVAWVSYHLSLLKAAPEVQEAVASGELGVGGAREITTLPKKEQVEALDGARKEAEKSGDVDKKTGKTKIKTKGARRQSRRSKQAKKKRQQTIAPLAQRESEQRQEVIAAFFGDTFGQKKVAGSHKKIVGQFWDYLMENRRLVIK